MAASKKWNDLPEQQRRIAAVAIGGSLVIVAAAERDLSRRPADQVRGSKLVWRIVCTNALGALGYFRWGRRPPAE